MPAVSEAISTTVTELPDSRVRVEATVSSQEVDKRIAETARQLGQNMRVPGFRKGKVPPPVIIKQLGREAVLDETVRNQLGRWYVDAIEEAGLKTVGDPDLDQLGDLPAGGEPLSFSFEIGVRPVATLGDYKSLEVGKREAVADDERIDAEVEQLRERMSRLETKDGQAAQGDYVVMDYEGFIDGEAFEGGAGRDQLLELGSSTLIPGFEEQLQGTSAGQQTTVEVAFPDDYNAEHLAGKDATFEVTVNEVKEKIAPELDDAFAEEAAGFDTLAELREDIAAKIREGEETQIDAEFREAVVDAAAAAATVEIPDTLVEARARELWDRMIHQLSHQGITPEIYQQISGKSEEETIEEGKPEAAQALRREAVLSAIVEAESLEPAEGDLLDALQASAAQQKTTPEKLRARLEKNGRLDELKEDLAQRMAVDLLVENATSISVEQARAKSLLWTPDKDEKESDGASAGGRTLWTPGS